MAVLAFTVCKTKKYTCTFHEYLFTNTHTYWETYIYQSRYNLFKHSTSPSRRTIQPPSWLYVWLLLINGHIRNSGNVPSTAVLISAEFMVWTCGFLEWNADTPNEIPATNPHLNILNRCQIHYNNHQQLTHTAIPIIALFLLFIWTTCIAFHFFTFPGVLINRFNKRCNALEIYPEGLFSVSSCETALCRRVRCLPALNSTLSCTQIPSH